MKRFTFEGKEGKLESMVMANMLMLLSRESQQEVNNKRVFECKTCNRQFPSFQALGGHRASHKKPRMSEDRLKHIVTASKPKVHECSVCGLEFGIGQALGGHMRRHRTTSETVVERINSNGKRILLDLNFPPLGDDSVERQELSLGLGLGLGLGSTPMVGFIH